MLFRHWQLSVLCASLWLTGMSVATKVLDGITDPGDYMMFYDPREECNKNTTELCLTSMKYCSTVDDDMRMDFHNGDTLCGKDARKDDQSWVSPDEFTWAQAHHKAVPVTPFSYLSMNVTWQNNNPEYPTTVMLRAAGLSKFSMYKVVPAGETQFTFSTTNTDMRLLEPAQLNSSDDNFYRMLNLAKAGHEFYFTVAQPDDPEFGDGYYAGGGRFGANASDVSGTFRFAEGLGSVLLDTQSVARDSMRAWQRISEKKWQRNVGIGVGVGVGVGMPIIALASYFVGRRVGGKRAGVKR